MPIKIIPPRKGPKYTFRGTYLGVYVDESSRTHKLPVARRLLRKLEERIEAGEYEAGRPAPDREQPTFVSAAVAYMETGGEARYLAPLISHFGETVLADIDQAAIEEAAAVLRPHVTAATRNRCVYTPCQAVLRHAGVEITLRRPKGAHGRIVTDALSKRDAAAVIQAADEIDPEYGLLLRFLLYTGCRLGEALALRCEDLRADERAAWVRTSKNGDPREVRLRPALAGELAALAATRTGRLFKYHQGGHLKHLLTRAKLAALGIACPVRRPTGWRQPKNRLAWLNHHSFCHTWATWMRRYAGADVRGLVETRRWKDERSAGRYTHVVARDEWDRVDDLPEISGESVERLRDAG